MHRLKKQQAIKLRLQGKSYNEIRRILNIPSKGTLSYWFKDLKLPLQAKKRLKQKIDLARKRNLFKYNRDRTKAIRIENVEIYRKAVKSIKNLTQKELLLVGTALYWGEGYKNDKNPTLSLVNSDPALIQLFMRFVHEILDVTNERIRTQIHIHNNLNLKQAIKFWSKLTRLPEKNFVIINQISRASRGKRPKNSLPYGTLDLRINSRRLYFKIKGFIKGLTQQIKL